MANTDKKTKSLIPCRVCGKLFEPCAYCQSHTDTFRWRNFACSKECAIKYIDDTEKYRKSLHDKENSEIVTQLNTEIYSTNNTIEDIHVAESSEETIAETRKRTRKKAIVENIVEE